MLRRVYGWDLSLNLGLIDLQLRFGVLGFWVLWFGGLVVWVWERKAEGLRARFLRVLGLEMICIVG